jgi:hypothetical protein
LTACETDRDRQEITIAITAIIRRPRSVMPRDFATEYF